MNYILVNTESYKSAKEKYANAPEWKNYSRRMIKNPFIRKILYDTYSHKCLCCDRTLRPEDMVIHHLTYCNTCKSANTICLTDPLSQKPEQSRQVPDCKSCFIESFDCFKSCFDLIAPVCTRCNWQLSQVLYYINHPTRGRPDKLILSKKHVKQDIEIFAYQSMFISKSWDDFFKNLNHFHILYENDKNENRFIMSKEQFLKITKQKTDNISARTLNGSDIHPSLTHSELKKYFESFES